MLRFLKQFLNYVNEVTLHPELVLETEGIVAVTEDKVAEPSIAHFDFLCLYVNYFCTFTRE